MSKRGTVEKVKSGEADYFISNRKDSKGKKIYAADLPDYLKTERKARTPSIETVNEAASARKLRELSNNRTELDKLSLDFERGIVTKKALDSPEFAKIIGEKVAPEIEKLTLDLVNKFKAETGEALKGVEDVTKNLGQRVADLKKDFEQISKITSKVGPMVESSAEEMTESREFFMRQVERLKNTTDALIRQSAGTTNENIKTFNNAVDSIVKTAVSAIKSASPLAPPPIPQTPSQVETAALAQNAANNPPNLP